MSREGGGLSWRGKVITDIDMELRVLLNEAREEGSFAAASCDLKTGKKMASLSVGTAWPLSECPALRSISAAPVGITAKSYHFSLRRLPTAKNGVPSTGRCRSFPFYTP